LPKRQAEQKFESLKQLLKQDATHRKEEIYRDMLKVYGHLQHGKKIIDIFESFKKAGVNADGDPKLAICRADAKECFCQKHEDGSAIFSTDSNINHRDIVRKTLLDIKLPARTFQWQKKDPAGSWPRYWNIKNEKIKTLVPIIPAKILVNEVKVLLRNFHILWEVDEWKPIPPKDPILLKQLTPNLFGVLATWNLSKLEQAIIRGRISG
jgi:hypothetical protein